MLILRQSGHGFHPNPAAQLWGCHIPGVEMALPSPVADRLRGAHLHLCMMGLAATLASAGDAGPGTTGPHRTPWDPTHSPCDISRFHINTLGELHCNWREGLGVISQ